MKIKLCVSQQLRYRSPIKIGAVFSAVALSLMLLAPFANAQGFYQASARRPYLVMQEITPNPEGAFDQLFAFYGEVGGMSPGAARVYVRSRTLPPALRLSSGEERVLRIFHFNDMHNNLTEFHSSRGNTHRFSQIVKRVNDARANAADNESVLFVSAGDDVTGTIFDELLGSDEASFITCPSYDAYSAAGLDVAVVGNHELDRGARMFELSVENSAAFPVLSANLYGSQFLDAADHPAAVIGVVNGIRVGFVGLTTIHESKLNPQGDPQFSGASPLETLETVLPAVARYSDVIVLLPHVGYDGEIDGVIRHPLDEGDLDLAEAASRITRGKPTVLIGGHTHTVLNANGLEVITNGVPILQAGEWGKNFGELEITLTAQGRSLAASYDYTMHATKKRDDRDPGNPLYEQDSDYDQVFDQTVMDPIIAQLDVVRAEVIGQSGSSTNITPEATRYDRYMGESAIANFLTDAIVSRSANFPAGPGGESQQVALAVFNSSAIISGIQTNSTITYDDWFNVMPYADHVVVTELSGQQLKDIIIDNAKRVVRDEELVENGGTINVSGFISRGKLNFSSGVRYEISLGANPPYTATAQNITLFGDPIDTVLGDTYKVAWGDYIIPNGNEGWNGGQIGGGMPDGVTGLDLRGIDYNDTGLIFRNETVEFLRSSSGTIQELGAVKDGRVVVVE